MRKEVLTMSIQSLANTTAHVETRPTAVRKASPTCASFQARLEKASAGTAGGPHHLCMGEDVACSGGIAGKNGKFQEFCAHYTEDSTPEDPIVRISGVANSGPFDLIRHINDIDPANASYAELAALRGHLAKTGQSVTDAPTLPHTMEFREDITGKYDFISGIRNSLSQPSRIIPTAASIAGANELLALYQNYTSGAAGAAPAPSQAGSGSGGLTRDSLLAALDEARLLLLRRTREGREWKKEQEEWDRLMKCLDRWIDALRDAAGRKSGDRSGGVTAEGGEALLSICRNLIAGAARAEAADTDQKDLLSALTAAQSTLLERLKEDKATEEEREAWADLLKRLDSWIESLREEIEDPEHASRPDSVSAAGQMDSKAEN